MSLQSLKSEAEWFAEAAQKLLDAVNRIDQDSLGIGAKMSLEHFAQQAAYRAGRVKHQIEQMDVKRETS